MGIARYVRWRLSPQGRAVYRSYARAVEAQRTLSAAPVRQDRARVTGYAAGWQDFERPQRGVRRAQARLPRYRGR